MVRDYSVKIGVGGGVGDHYEISFEGTECQDANFVSGYGHVADCRKHVNES
jgi:hypothetical protein